jgi:hypothetical protein
MLPIYLSIYLSLYYLFFSRFFLFQCSFVGKTISLNNGGFGESPFQCVADDVLTDEKLNFLIEDLLVYAQFTLESALKVGGMGGGGAR